MEFVTGHCSETFIAAKPMADWRMDLWATNCPEKK